MAFVYPAPAIHKTNYTPYLYLGVWYIAVPRAGGESGSDRAYTQFVYILSNPITVLNNSKLEMKRELVSFLMAGPNKVVVQVSSDDHWLIRFPTDFLVNTAYQPGNTKEDPQRWHIAGTGSTTVVIANDGSRTGGFNANLMMIPDRAFNYAEVFGVTAPGPGSPVNSAYSVRERWGSKITKLLEVKY